jgi:hypothetical protein
LNEPASPAQLESEYKKALPRLQLIASAPMARTNSNDTRIVGLVQGRFGQDEWCWIRKAKQREVKRLEPKCLELEPEWLEPK